MKKAIMYTNQFFGQIGGEEKADFAPVINVKRQDVYYISLAITFIVVIWAMIAKDNFSNFSNGLLKFLTENFGWSYLISMVIFVVFSLILAFSKYGKIRLGADDSKPEYSTKSWFAMLFGAGMGIGLVFWGVADPISHFIAPPGITPGTEEAARFAMKASFMHWGFHPWANYAIIGLSLAYFQFRKNKPGLISSIFEPLIGEKGVKGPIGKTIDILAVFATVAGVATSLGLGTMQTNSGLKYLFNIPETQTVQILIISIIYIWTAGINLGVTGAVSMDALKQIVAAPETAFFVVMAKYKLGSLLSFIAVFLLGTFFITSANSATFVLGMLTSGGDLNPSNKKKIVWGVVQALLAASLLLAGGLKALQTISVAAAFPFIFVMIFACVSLWKALKSEDIAP